MLFRPVSLAEFMDMYQFSPSQMFWSGRNSLVAHEAHGLEDTASAEALKEFLPRVGTHIQTYTMVKAKENQPVNPELVEANNKVRVCYSRFVTRLHDDIKVFGADSPRGKAAQKILSGSLGIQVSSVTNVDRVEQESQFVNAVTEIETSFLAEVATLELTAHFEALKSATDRFIELMTRDSMRVELPSLSELEVARKELQSEMYGCIFQMLASYPKSTDEHAKMRAALIGPFAIQNDRIAEYQRTVRGGKRSLPAVDPDTGVIIEEVEPTSPAVEEPIQPVVAQPKPIAVEDPKPENEEPNPKNP